MWDVRARTPVYELATGNNQVNSLAWDSDRNCLYAATECWYQDRYGYHHDYRISKRWQTEYLDKDDRESDIAWPKQAWHDEYYFGYAFDAGEHRICQSFWSFDRRTITDIKSLDRYAFKEDPDRSKMPEYGSASVNESRY